MHGPAARSVLERALAEEIITVLGTERARVEEQRLQERDAVHGPNRASKKQLEATAEISNEQEQFVTTQTHIGYETSVAIAHLSSQGIDSEQLEQSKSI